MNREELFLSACKAGRMETIVRLIDRNVLIDCKIRDKQDENYGYSSLDLACKYGHIDIVKLLLPYFNVEKLREDLSNIAMSAKNFEIARIIIDYIELKENFDDKNIDVELATQLIQQQFPNYADQKIRSVEQSGWDNRTFRLGDKMLIRMPSQRKYAAQVEKEQKFLPILYRYLSLETPIPIAMGKPNINYPYHWSIYKWIEGKSANIVPIENINMNDAARTIAKFINQLHRVSTDSGPSPGLYNFWRGGNLSIYDIDTRKFIRKLKNIIDAKAAIKLWERALSTNWHKPAVWVHGDLSLGNIIVRGSLIHAIIDFGCSCIGDPACDLAIYWTFFNGEFREIFKKYIMMDEETWLRAKAWALWKASYELAHLEDKTNIDAKKYINIIEDVLTN